MKMVNKLRIFLILIVGLVSVNSSFAYDDIYASTKKGGEKYAQQIKEHSQGKADRNAKWEEIEKHRNMIIIKSPNVERYDLVSNEFIAVIDTTLKKDDAYVMDTIRIMDEFGDLEKTLMLKTKGKQNVYFDNGAIVIEDSASVASGNFVTDTLISVDNGDYEYTKRLNKYHGTDYNVVSVDDNNAAETSVESSNTTVYVGVGYPYYRYYGWHPYYTGYYDPYWGYYDPYWGYYGYYGYYTPYRYSYYYHPYHHYHWHAPIYHHGHGGRYSASNGSYGRGRTDGARVPSGNSTARTSIGTRSIERSSTRSVTSGRTTTVSRSQGSSARPSVSTSSTTLRRSFPPSSSTSGRTSSNGSRSYSNGSSVRGNSSGSSSSYSGRSSYSAPRSSSPSTNRSSSGSSSTRSSSYGSYGGSSRSGSSSGGSYSSGSSRSGGYSSGSSNSGSRSFGGGSSSSRGGSHSGGGRR